MHWQPIALLIAFAPVPAERPPDAKLAKEVAALERKLHGEWCGQGGCVGDIVFHPNGRYERSKQGPDGADSEGTWAVRWDALPPTLVLDCKTSTDRDLIGRREVKLILLDDAAFSYQYPKSPPVRYERAKR